MVVHRVSSSLLGPVDPSFRALSERLQFTGHVVCSIKILGRVEARLVEHFRSDLEVGPLGPLGSFDYRIFSVISVVCSSLIGCKSCIVNSFRSRSSFISSPLWTP